MAAALGPSPATAFDDVRRIVCNAGCALLPTTLVKFFEWLNKPVHFRRRPTAEDLLRKKAESMAESEASGIAAASIKNGTQADAAPAKSPGQSSIQSSTQSLNQSPARLAARPPADISIDVSTDVSANLLADTAPDSPAIRFNTAPKLADSAFAQWTLPAKQTGDHAKHHAAQLPQRIDEAALLFSTGQPDAAAQVLMDALATLATLAATTSATTPAGHERALERQAWWMLLELYALQQQRAEFDLTALAYAQRFEASPPQWPLPFPESNYAALPQSRPSTHGPTPLLLQLRDRLDDSLQSQLAQWQSRPGDAKRRSIDLNSGVMLDLATVHDADLRGCHHLLALLADWQRHGVPVQLRHSEALLTALRALIQSGRRDADDVGWRLLIELLRLAGDVERYEDACLAYSLTYEMSPPAAPPPVSSEDQAEAPGLSTSLHQSTGGDPIAAAAYALPSIITMPVDALLVALRAHVRRNTRMQDLIIDARSLQRIDFHAASALQAGMAELAAGKPVEWQGVSFLVSTLLQMTSGSAKPKIINRKP